MKAAEMFQVLLKDARSRDIIQTSYDTLLEHLEGALLKLGDLLACMGPPALSGA